jgi:hypothetical protein
MSCAAHLSQMSSRPLFLYSLLFLSISHWFDHMCIFWGVCPCIWLCQTRAQNLLVVGSVTFYFAASLLLVFLNKHVLSGGLKINHATVFLTWTQIVVTVVLSYLFCQLRSNTNFLKFLTPWEYKIEVAIQIWPVTLSFLGMYLLACLPFPCARIYCWLRMLLYHGW